MPFRSQITTYDLVRALEIPISKFCQFIPPIFFLQILPTESPPDHPSDHHFRIFSPNFHDNLTEKI